MVMMGETRPIRLRKFTAPPMARSDTDRRTEVKRSISYGDLRIRWVHVTTPSFT